MPSEIFAVDGDRRVTRIYYRADKRYFEVGAPIATAGEFSARHGKDGHLAEDLLAERKPATKSNRYDCLMLFEDEECAKDFWAKMTGGRLYTVSISEGSILHRGDMHFVNDIAAKLAKGEKAVELADAYWEGEESDVPCIEILVSSGTVLAELGTEKERIDRLKRLFGISSTEPESTINPIAGIPWSGVAR